MGKADDRDMTHRPEPVPTPVAWYGNWKLWIGAAGVVILAALVYAAL